MTKHARPLLACAGLLAFMADGHAAGGHFDVDDAAVLDPGHCQYEAWVAREPRAAATLLHVGPGCRVGPVEIGVNFERAWLPSETRSSLGPQLKWVADPLVGALSAGVAWNAYFDLTHGGAPAHTAYVPLTWWAAEKLWVHANLGADWSAAHVRTRRIGVSGEWAANETLTLIAERVKFVGAWTSRVGARFNLNESISVDLSAARVAPRGAGLYVIGVNHDFAH